MSVPASCPGHDCLKGLLDSSLPEEEQSRVVCHLDACKCCQDSLEALAAGNSSWPEALRQAEQAVPPATSAYWSALRELESEPATQLPAARPPLSDGGPEEDERVPLDFLQAAESPEYLGRIGHFDILEVLGKGGMGVVLRAFDPCLQRQVAVKVLNPRLAHNELARKRFCREARAAAAVSHENVVTVLQVEREESNDLPFLVMQLVTGESLQERLDRVGPLPLLEILRIGAQTAAGLAAAHAQGLIHRDVKPANILLEQATGRVKLTDFGLARATEDVKLTQTGHVAGTPLYMAPEQARGEPVDHRADLFSLGSVLYALCTGRPPFGGSTPFLVLKSLTEERPRPIRDINPDIPQWLVDVVDRLHAKDPGERFQSAAEVADLLAGRLALLQYSSDHQLPVQIQKPPPCPPCTPCSRTRLLVLLAPLLLLSSVLLSEGMGLTRLFTALFRGRDVEAETTPPRDVLHAGTGPIWSVAFAPDGQTLALALDNGTVKLWDLPGRGVRTTLNAHKGAVWSLAFLPDGKTLATAGSDMSVRLWDLASGTERRGLPHAGAVRALAISGDGQRLAAGCRDGAVVLWNLTGGEGRTLAHAHAGEVVAIAFSRDGSLVASAGGDETIKLWDAASGRERLTLRGHRGGVYAVALSPDGRTLASGGWDHTLRLWNTATGETLAVLPAHGADVWAMAFAPSGTLLASASEDRMVKLWDIPSAQERATYRGHTGTLYAVAFSPDGRTLASGGRDGTVRLWDVMVP